METYTLVLVNIFHVVMKEVKVNVAVKEAINWVEVVDEDELNKGYLRKIVAE